MIAWLLKELEKNPETLFRKADLLKKSKSKFEKLTRQGFLSYCQPDPHHETYPCSISCPNTCPMEVVEMEKKLFAICPKDTEVDPTPLTKEEVSKYRFSLERLIKAVREANGLTGNNFSLNQRLYFMGERVVGQVNTAFIFALFPNLRTAEPHLLNLPPQIPPSYQQIIIVTPSLHINRMPLYAKLRVASMFPVVLPQSFGQRGFKINYLAALRKRRSTGVNPKILDITIEQEKDYEKHGYLCKDRLYIPGIFPRERSNDILLNGHKLSLGDSLFVLLLCFAVELKKGKGGWVSSPKLQENGYISDSTHYQPYSNLRRALEGSLKEKDGKKFIEASGSRKYRISTHPDFVKYDREKLLNHPDTDIVKLAKKLPHLS